MLVDPPFEAEGEFDRLVDGLLKAHRRWPGGLALLWYPIKDRAAVAQFRTRLAGAGVPRVLDIRFPVRTPSTEPRLDGSGLIAVNPPFLLEAELAVILPALATLLAEPGAPAPESGVARARNGARRVSCDTSKFAYPGLNSLAENAWVMSSSSNDDASAIISKK